MLRISAINRGWPWQRPGCRRDSLLCTRSAVGTKDGNCHGRLTRSARSLTRQPSGPHIGSGSLAGRTRRVAARATLRGAHDGAQTDHPARSPPAVTRYTSSGVDTHRKNAIAIRLRVVWSDFVGEDARAPEFGRRKPTLCIEESPKLILRPSRTDEERRVLRPEDEKRLTTFRGDAACRVA